MLVRVYYGFSPEVWCAVEVDPENWLPVNHGVVVMRALTLMLAPVVGFAVDHNIRERCLHERAAGRFYHYQHAWAIGRLHAVNWGLESVDDEKVKYSYDTGEFSVGGAAIGLVGPGPRMLVNQAQPGPTRAMAPEPAGGFRAAAKSCCS
jgi:hypothetical protein